MRIETMEDLFLHHLADIYFAEKQIVKALPKIADAVASTELQQALEHHLEETEEHVTRLEQVFQNCDQEPFGEQCPAIEGLIEEAEELIENVEDDDVLTAGLLAGAQAVEHYEISRYGTLCAWGRLLGYDDSVKLLEETLAEEKNADMKLSEIAMSEVNRMAA